MSIKTKIKKELKAIERYELSHRSNFARAGSLLLTAATVFSLTGLGHDDRRQFNGREAVVAKAAQLSPAEKNETVRMPIKFDDGLRSIATTGE